MAEYSFLLDAAIYLVATVVFVPVAARLGLGSVIGYLLAGCIIGPFGLGLIRDVEAIFHFAEFGVVLMLFVIGLELEVGRLRELRRSVFVGGALQMVGCSVVLVAGLLVAGLPVPATVLAALSLALSSTAVGTQTMAERGILASPTGRAAFGVLLFQDLAAIPIIAVVPLLAATPSAESGSAWLGIGKVAAAVLTVVALGRLVVLPVLRTIARLHLRDVFTAFALLVVIATALLMQLADVSMALGAFLAGVLLASSEYRHALETDIEPFRGLLMGLFFVAVGMSIDFGLLGSRPGTVLALVAGYTALKLAALWVLAGPIGVPRDGRPMFAAVLAQGSEFAFVVFGVAGAAQVLPGDWNALLTLVVALSMCLTPSWCSRRSRCSGGAAPRSACRIPSRPSRAGSSSSASAASGRSSAACSSRAASARRCSTTTRTTSSCSAASASASSTATARASIYSSPPAPTTRTFSWTRSTTRRPA